MVELPMTQYWVLFYFAILILQFLYLFAFQKSNYFSYDEKVDLTAYVEKHEFCFDAVIDENVTNDEVRQLLLKNSNFNLLSFVVMI
jgi:hypothetical protein